KAADGCMRDAESVLDQLIAFSQKDIKLADVVAILGIIEEDAFLRFMDACLDGETSTALRLIADISAKGKDMDYFLEGLLEHCRNLMVLKIVRDSREELVDLPKEMIADIAAQAQRMELSDIMTAVNQIFAAQEMSRKLNTTRIPLEVLAVKLAGGIGKKKPGAPPAHREPQAVPAAVVKPAAAVAKRPLSILKEERGSVGNRLSSFASLEKAPDFNRPSSAAEAGGAQASCSLQDIQNSWDRFIRHLGGVKMSLSTYLRESTPVKCEGGWLTIGFPKSAVFFKEALEHKDNLKIVEEAVAAVYEVRLNLKLEIVEGLAAPAQDDGHFEETPFFKSAMDLFKGKVVKK
ncbi:MAG: hypothetical protein PHH75_08525, partial [Candidatus Omnitrophica bacterium]|nr:hypothetical protein [Candidatus Omnitrophota bacterium]